MHTLNNAPRKLNREESSRPIMVNNVITTLGSFLYLNDPAFWPTTDVAALLAMEPGEVRTFGGGAQPTFDVERID